MSSSCTICGKTFSRPDAVKRHEMSHTESHLFLCPANIMITGCTGSGKTTFVKKLLDNPQLFHPEPCKVLYCYGVWQPLFKHMSNVKFHEGLPTQEEIDNFADGRHNLLVLDDQMSEIVKDEDTEKLFTRGSHHKNITVLYLSQNAFCQGKCARTISLNCAYVVLFRNPRDIYQIKLLGRQVGLPNTLPEAYNDSMMEHYGYLVVDMSPRHTGLPRLCTHIFPDETQVCYVPV